MPPTLITGSLDMQHSQLHPRDKLLAYWQLTRMDKPIGIYLLLWPTLWALWIASEGQPRLDLLLIFISGVILMRAAGCVINDFADRNVDGHVKRTALRPLPSGRVTEREALILFGLLIACAFCLVLLTNRETILLSFAGAALAALYPFMKRFTYYPQVVLGAAFSWGIPMAFTAHSGELPRVAWLIYIANLLWTVAYDTLYAMVDRDDDLKIGVKSTAVLLGEFDRIGVALLQGLTLLTLLLVGLQLELSLYYHLGLIAALLLFAQQQWQIRSRDRSACFQAFLNNHWVGAIIFAGIFADSLLG